jgi:hypothetical protein
MGAQERRVCHEKAVPRRIPRILWHHLFYENSPSFLQLLRFQPCNSSTPPATVEDAVGYRFVGPFTLAVPVNIDVTVTLVRRCVRTVTLPSRPREAAAQGTRRAPGWRLAHIRARWPVPRKT